MRLLLLVILLLSYSLVEALDMQKRSYPSAVVTSGFSDPRGISRYRSQPGLHLGYDIAMPYGAKVYCVWPGRVEAVIPWHGTEVGVRVRHPDGSSATYGHVHSLVAVGQEVARGQALATIASDHLDIKMRDAAGQPWDFGGQPRVVSGSVSGSVSDPGALREELRQARARLKAPSRSREAIALYVEHGILSSRQAEQALEEHRRYEEQQARIARLQGRLEGGR